jgi:hypothetical protein
MARKRKTSRELAHERGEHDKTIEHQCPLCREVVLERVERLITSQAQLRSMLRTLKKEYGFVDEPAREIIMEAMERLEEDGRVGRPFRRSTMRASLQRAYQIALAQGQVKYAIVALDKLCRLDGLYSPVEIKNVATIAENVRAMTSADQRRRLESLIAGYAKGKAEGGPPN